MFETIKKMFNKTNRDDMQNRHIIVQNTLDYLQKNMPCKRYEKIEKSEQEKFDDFISAVEKEIARLESFPGETSVIKYLEKIEGPMFVIDCDACKHIGFNTEVKTVAINLKHFVPIMKIMHKYMWTTDYMLDNLFRHCYSCIKFICLDVNVLEQNFYAMNRKMFKLPFFFKDYDALHKIDDELCELFYESPYYRRIARNPYLKIDEVEKVKEIPQWENELKARLDEIK